MSEVEIDFLSKLLDVFENSQVFVLFEEGLHIFLVIDKQKTPASESLVDFGTGLIAGIFPS